MLQRPMSALPRTRLAAVPARSLQAVLGAAATTTSRPFSSSSTSFARRSMNPVPERKQWTKGPRIHPYTKEQLEDEDLKKKLAHIAGSTIKQRLKNIQVQTRYFEEQVRLQDRHLAVQENQRGLPDITEAEIDDFYVNLLASGNELGNLETLPSPTHVPIQKQTPLHLLRETEDKRTTKQLLDRLAHAMVVERRAKLAAPVETEEGRQLEAPQVVEEEKQAEHVYKQEQELVMVQAPSRLSSKLKAMELEQVDDRAEGAWSAPTMSLSERAREAASQSFRERYLSGQASENSLVSSSISSLSLADSALALKSTGGAKGPPGSPANPLPATESLPKRGPKYSSDPTNETILVNLHKLSITDLRNICLQSGIPETGSKYELVQRVFEHRSKAPPVAMPSHLKVQEPNLQWRDEPSHAGPSTSSSSSASNATLLGLETASSGSVSHSLASSSLFDHSVLPIQRSPLVTSLARSVEAAEAAAATGARREPLEVRDPLPKGLARDKGKGRARPPLPVPLGLLTTSEWDETVTTTLRSGEPKNGTRSAREAGYRRLEFARRGLLPVRNRRQQIDAIRQAAGAMEAAFVLDLQQRSGHKTIPQQFYPILDSLADAGDVRGTEMVIEQANRVSGLMGKPVDPKIASYIVLAHLGNADLHNAIASMHLLEDRMLAPEMSIYQALITPLVNSKISAHRASGWDLFSHMRLVAHSIPNKELYTTMITACAHKDHPEPERGLDLWTEMTLDNAIQPDVSAFNAAIRAAGSVKKFYLEAFRIMRQMLDFYHTSSPHSEQRALYTPNRETFDALLAGAKRNGDIARTRWILTEMIRFSNSVGMPEDGHAISPDAHTMTEVFQAYASAKPTISRAGINAVKQVTEGIQAPREAVSAPEITSSAEAPALSSTEVTSSTSPSSPSATSSTSMAEEASFGPAVESSLSDPPIRKEVEGAETISDEEITASQMEDAFASSYTEQPNHGATNNLGGAFSSASPHETPNVHTSATPRSRGEILNEAERLLSHVVVDAKIYRTSRFTPRGTLPALRHVRLTTELVNSYLSVHYEHGHFLSSLDKFTTIFEELGVERNAHSYAGVLELCRTRKSNQRELAAEKAFELFKEWEAYEKKAEETLRGIEEIDGKRVANKVRDKMGMGPRNIERIWVAMINIMACAHQLSLARTIVERFVKLYPPSLISCAKLPPLPTKALVRAIPRHTIRPDPLPPHLLFPDLNLLHKAYVIYQQEKGIAYVKWVSQSYLGALRRYQESKLDDGPEGVVREREKKFYARLEEIEEQAHPKDPNLKFKKGFATLEMMSGEEAPKPPPELKKGSLEWKIQRAHGKLALAKYQRAIRSF